jgi:hypothetical protein
LKFDFLTLYLMHRNCASTNFNLSLSSLSLSVRVRKLHVFFKVCTSTYWYVLLCTNVEFSYCYVTVPSCTGMYQYVPLRTNLPDPVQGYRIPDAGKQDYVCVTFMWWCSNTESVPLRLLVQVPTYMTLVWYVTVLSTYWYVPVCTRLHFLYPGRPGRVSLAGCTRYVPGPVRTCPAGTYLFRISHLESYTSTVEPDRIGQNRMYLRDFSAAYHLRLRATKFIQVRA